MKRYVVRLGKSEREELSGTMTKGSHRSKKAVNAWPPSPWPESA